METESEVRMSGGREFHRRGADRLKALDPMMVVKLADGAKSWLAEEDRRDSRRCVDVNKVREI